MSAPTIISDAVAGEHAAPPAAPSVWPFTQIGPFLDYLRVECGLADNTILAYRRDLNAFGGFCADQKLTDPDDLTPLAVQQHLRQLSQQGLVTASIARHLAAIRMFLRFHVLSNVLRKDAFSVLETPKTWQLLPKVLSQAKTIELITAVNAGGLLCLRDRALLELLYATGMCASEAAGLSLKDVNFQVGFLRCLGKGRKERIVPVHEFALATLRVYLSDLRPRLLGDKDCPALFLSRTGQPLSRIEVWRIVRRAALYAGLTGKISPHTLRHCFGSHLLQGGADLRSVQEMLGHADVTTTQIYTHVDQQYLQKIHRKYHPRP